MLTLSDEILVFTYPEESLLQDNFMFHMQNKDALEHFNQAIWLTSAWGKSQSKDKAEGDFFFPPVISLIACLLGNYVARRSRGC